MKQSAKKFTALGLSAVLAIGGVSGAVYASASEQPKPAEAPVKLSAAAPEAAPAACRDETVYILSDAGGGVEKVIVSGWLKNPDGLEKLLDGAALTDVENVKGSETYTSNGAYRIWDAQGGDVYTQGGTDQPLPVEMTVSYTLDGQPITPDQLAGKSGKVTIRFDYINKQYEEVEIGGKTEKIYVPFAVLTAAALDNDCFRNIAVTNGRLYNDGNRTAVIGLALPGLRESLDLDEKDIDIPDYVEITADAEDFTLETTFTAALCDPFQDLDTSRLEDADGLSASLDELTDAMEQLMDGSAQLYDGLGELLEKSETLSGAVNQLSDGAAALKAGGAELQTGAAQLKDGASSLQTGLEKLNGSSEQLTAGAQQIFDGLLASANQQLAASGAEVPELTAENYAQVLDGAAASMGDSPAAAQLKGLKASLDGCSGFCQGLRQYTAGVAEASGGAAQLSAGIGSLSVGAGSLYQGADQLNAGLGQLKNSVPALLDGVTRLHDGAGELTDGLREFNEKGVQKIVDAFDGDLDLLAERLDATVNAAKDYQTFSGGGEAEGQVKFIYRTAPIEMAE